MLPTSSGTTSQTVVTRLVDQPCRAIGSLVEPQPVYAERRRWEIPLLGALLLIAAIVRFWGVGSFGLHKPDEDTTALPAVHILQDGAPRFPNGMFYARAIGQSYLIAAAVKVFGQTEWALRLPSVLTGIALVLLAYFLGRRFLKPFWNMAFVGVVVFLPGMIADSQEVRMYIFLSASLAVFLISLFRWERTGHVRSLVVAVIALLVGIQFQEVAIFSSMLLLFPGLAHGDAHKLRLGLIAFLVTAAGYFAISHWMGSFYPVIAGNGLHHVSQMGEAPNPGMARVNFALLAPALVIALALVWLNVRTIATRSIAALSGALLLLGLTMQVVLFYHLAAILLLAGLIVARRHGGSRGVALWSLLAACALLSGAHWWLLHAAMGGPGRKIIGVMVGQPSIWPYLQVAAYSQGAMLLVAGALGVNLWRLAAGGKISDDALFSFMGIFVPLFGIGFFGWYIPPRYGEFALLPLLLCALVAAQRLVDARLFSGRPAHAIPVAGLATLAAVVIVNPLAAAHSINAGSRFADHRAAARYMRSIHLGPRDVVVAEEVLMQTYYLGHVDYWLTGPDNAANFAVPVGGVLVDEYTNTPVIDTAERFRELMRRPNRGFIYVIGSGEDQADGRLFERGPAISELLHEPEFETVYLAPDGLTRVWRIAPAALSSGAKG